MKKDAGPKVKTVGDEEVFINLLRVACDDRAVNDTLEKLLSQPDDRRKALVHNWVSELVVNNAPKDFMRAIACLLDDRVAEKAYEVIFQCQRKSVLPSIFKRK
jgi:hypothetical protein